MEPRVVCEDGEDLSIHSGPRVHTVQEERVGEGGRREPYLEREEEEGRVLWPSSPSLLGRSPRAGKSPGPCTSTVQSPAHPVEPNSPVSQRIADGGKERKTAKTQFIALLPQQEILIFHSRKSPGDPPITLQRGDL